jgi:hypothetical protein
MEALCSSEILATTYETIHKPEDQNADSIFANINLRLIHLKKITYMKSKVLTVTNINFLL